MTRHPKNGPAARRVIPTVTRLDSGEALVPGHAFPGDILQNLSNGHTYIVRGDGTAERLHDADSDH